MPQSLSNVLTHLVFSTKDRKPLISDLWRDALHGYVTGIIHRYDGNLIAINSVKDHIHILFGLPRTMTIADLVREIKTGASKWIQQKDPGSQDFHWQAGYGVFSVSPSHKEALIRYIADQPEHHKVVTFRDEYLRLLEKYEIQPDRRYMWD